MEDAWVRTGRDPGDHPRRPGRDSVGFVGLRTQLWRYASESSTASRVAGALLVGATAAVIVIDLVSDVWSDRPMIAALVANAIVLGFTVIVVNQYIAFRARGRWAPVAAYALDDLGGVSESGGIEEAGVASALT